MDSIYNFSLTSLLPETLSSPQATAKNFCSAVSRAALSGLANIKNSLSSPSVFLPILSTATMASSVALNWKSYNTESELNKYREEANEISLSDLLKKHTMQNVAKYEILTNKVISEKLNKELDENGFSHVISNFDLQDLEYINKSHPNLKESFKTAFHKEFSEIDTREKDFEFDLYSLGVEGFEKLRSQIHNSISLKSNIYDPFDEPKNVVDFKKIITVLNSVMPESKKNNSLEFLNPSHVKAIEALGVLNSKEEKIFKNKMEIIDRAITALHRNVLGAVDVIKSQEYNRQYNPKLAVAYQKTVVNCHKMTTALRQFAETYHQVRNDLCTEFRQK